MLTRISVSSILTALLALGIVHPASATNTLERVVSADPHGIVEITNVSGEIEVSGWDRNEVSVHADYGDGVERIDITSEPGRTVIKVVLPSMTWRWGSHSGSADLKVRLPKDSKLDVSAVSADVSSTGMDGPQQLRTVSGEITAEINGADQEVKTVSGGVHLRGRGQQGSMHVTTISGDMSLEHAAGSLDASSVSGGLDVRLDSASSVRLRTTSGHVKFEGRLMRGASVDAESVSGGLTVRAPSDEGYAYDVSSFSGHINDCFNVEPERVSRYGPGTRLNGSLGKGSGQVRLKTMSGSVQLCDR
jgi:DUF4097 and DUF4098 domain-containing protein YvlB